ncbi:transcription antitermination factor NusB [Teredinibacter sp. KSP-S5-2]|uniref:transcription antitermination factor NusB n=1 Tax=Teredinibacter sp. KSP-S5-2 TaxID=3034506 RepID=UPI0029349CD5|nr:transcription antitermination factor NusB [Teredinibacter sp. KSP-S5-2]WNO11766.1 transcription antitermination factor NusB [Teredinibacter sp. KSP-S5-2]
MKLTAATRSRARHYAMQAIYQWQMTGNPLNVIEAEFHTDNDMSKVDTEYFHELFHGVAAQKSELDALFQPHLKNMVIDQLDPVTMALLRLSTYELKHRIDVPYKVVINESLNLAKKFGAEDSHKFINGVLDKTAAQLRAAEVGAGK